MTELRYEGRVAAITGAGRGIGRAYAELLASRGAAIVVNDLGGSADGAGQSTAPADEVVECIRRSGGRAVANHQSVCVPEGAASIISDALRNFGRIDIVINNAGILRPRPFEQMEINDFRLLLEVHFFGTLLVTQAAWPHMCRAGYGRIINTCSPTLWGLPGFTSYGASKGAIFGLTRSLATEAPAGVKVNAISPGAFTRMANTGIDAAAAEWMSKVAPTELVSPVAAYLAHDSCALNGEVLTSQGGIASRWLIGEAEGFRKVDLTPEDVAAHIDRITAAEPFHAFSCTTEAMDYFIKRVR